MLDRVNRWLAVQRAVCSRDDIFTKARIEYVGEVGEMTWYTIGSSGHPSRLYRLTK